MLHQRGGLGVTPVDFAGPDVIDGGAPIMRVAGRINDLRNEGYVIRTFKKGQVAKYVLVPQGFALSSSPTGNSEVVVTTGAGANCSTESPVVATPVSGRSLESPPEDFDYVNEEELSWV
jgi:hypothetical protein